MAIEWCEKCDGIIDELHARKGYTICRKCSKKESDKKYYEKNKEEIKERNRTTKREKLAGEKIRKATLEENARVKREQRYAKKQHT